MKVQLGVFPLSRISPLHGNALLGMGERYQKLSQLIQFEVMVSCFRERQSLILMENNSKIHSES